MNVTKLLTAWPIKGPCQTSSLRRGMNNRVWRVEAADGQIYVLRVLPDELALPRVRYEAALLHALSEKQLPFRLPLPLKANSGDIIVPVELESGKNTIATLQAFLPGSTPDRHDSIKAAQAGEALAVLDTALATLPELHAPEQPQLFSSFADLTHCHPLVPDPLIAIERLPIERELSRRICAYLSMVMARWDELHNRLPQQLLHRDYDPSNILMDASGVTAVLDFEFAGKDIRVLELCVALSWWPVNLMGTGKEWKIIDAFGAAYVRSFPLSEAELRAIPDVLRLRAATSLVHRTGRYLAGLESDAVIVNKLEESLWREEWLSANQETLLQHVLAWNAI
ncbi:MAG TPA: phosphotransferase [Ktedonobacteraceae bacterium]|nr:phosphotransferase [Ktedonobacteraceae bacterium]